VNEKELGSGAPVSSAASRLRTPAVPKVRRDQGLLVADVIGAGLPYCMRFVSLIAAGLHYSPYVRCQSCVFCNYMCMIGCLMFQNLIFRNSENSGKPLNTL